MTMARQRHHHAWTINFGFVVSDSFSLSRYIPLVTSFSFAAWMLPGDVLQSAEVSITSEEFGGTTYFDQTLAFTQSGCVSNQYGYNVCTETAGMGLYSINAGTYWVNLQNAVVTNGDPVYWDENSGPSQASENTLGTLPSESFTVGGYTCIGCGCSAHPDCGPPSPEPASWLLLGSGVVTIFSFLSCLSRKFF